MTLGIFKLFADICSWMSVVILILCLYRFRTRDKIVKLIALIFFASVAVDAVINAELITVASRNIPQNLWVLLLVVVMLVVYDEAWNHRYRVLTIVNGSLFLGFALWNLLLGQRHEFNSNTLVFGGLVILVHSLVYFYDLLVKLPVQRLERLPMFWFNAAYLFYCASSLFIFAAYVVDVFRNSLLLYWTIQNVLRFVQFILIIVGLWQDLRNIRSRSLSASEQ